MKKAVKRVNGLGPRGKGQQKAANGGSRKAKTTAHCPPPTARNSSTAARKSDREKYAAHSDAARERQARIAQAGKEIGPLPAVVNPKRRAAALASLEVFYRTYFPRAFKLDFSPDHKTVISRIEEAVTRGGLFGVAMPRGRGKTTMLLRAGLWAIFKRLHPYVMLTGANDGKAEKLRKALLNELSRNKLLLEDFPEWCYPIACLKGIHNKCAGQTLDGESTLMDLTGDQLILPTVNGQFGGVIESAGLLTATRGAQYCTADGDVIRPSLVFADDPQTRESARSLPQTEERHEILTGDLFGLAGPGETITVLCACTKIYQGDLACLLLDRERSPEWRGETFRMLKSFPKRMDLWEEWYELRRMALRNDAEFADFTAAREFYRQRFEIMNEGAEVDWPEAIGKDRLGEYDLSAIETAMLLFFFNEDSFWAERQNDPRNLLDQEDQFLDAKSIAAKESGYLKRAVPLEVEHLTAFVDIHQRLLYWMVCGWSPNFEGFILDYGAFPKQKSQFFAMSKARPTLMEVYRKAGKEGAIYQGLTDLLTLLFKCHFVREDGAEMSIEACLVDRGWSQMAAPVTKAIREHPMRSRICPSLGRAYDENMTPISKFKAKAGELLGEEWFCPPLASRNALRDVIFDTNYWKTFVHRRLATQRGDGGSLTINGKPGQKHDLLSRHLSAEFRQVVTGRRRADIWKMRPGETDNHWLDCLTGCAVAASVRGVRLLGSSHRKLVNPDKPATQASMTPDADGRVSYVE